MNYHGALKECEDQNLMTKIDVVKYTKYKGLNEFGIGYTEEGANIMIYKKN